VVGAARRFIYQTFLIIFFVDADSVARRKIFWPSERADFRNFRGRDSRPCSRDSLGLGFSALRQPVHFGERLTHAHFATARLLAMGPGRDYLRTTCAFDPIRYAL